MCVSIDFLNTDQVNTKERWRPNAYKQAELRRDTVEIQLRILLLSPDLELTLDFRISRFSSCDTGPPWPFLSPSTASSFSFEHSALCASFLFPFVARLVP